ncbi:O-methyltransferase [Namhaeicola litoreus]|uniref:O-methyltransferase n=1 Tax=Namhaeicola litoreus TaxID=1052145 RepID=A0ABW3XZM8_9FLAO
MEFISKELDVYVVNHSEDEPELLSELSKETWQKVLAPRMLSGHYQGRLLSLISKMIHPKTILEIGTYTGYSALCLAEGLKQNGILHTIDKNEELADFQQRFFDQSPYKDQIVKHMGDALEIIPMLKEKFDLVFIDADKSNYSNYFDLVIDKMNRGGIILSDNVLWSGKVLEKVEENDIDTEQIILFNQKVKEDNRVETILLPIRDGLSLCRVK